MRISSRHSQIEFLWELQSKEKKKKIMNTYCIPMVSIKSVVSPLLSGKMNTYGKKNALI
jgi:hypothetical protein